MERREARAVVYKMLYASRFNTEDYNELLHFAAEGNDIDSKSSEYISNTYNGIISNFDELEQKVMSKINTYTKERVYSTDMVAMIYGTYELLFTDIEPKIAINEAVNLVKKFSTEKSIKFVNGVLSNIFKDKNE